MNARSLSPKIDEIQLLLKELKPDLLCITETWLNYNNPDTEVEVTDYKVIRNDRKVSHGGGVAMYVRQNRNFIYEIIENNA